MGNVAMPHGLLYSPTDLSDVLQISDRSPVTRRAKHNFRSTNTEVERHTHMPRFISAQNQIHRPFLDRFAMGVLQIRLKWADCLRLSPVHFLQTDRGYQCQSQSPHNSKRPAKIPLGSFCCELESDRGIGASRQRL
jgi:hypothetical protein